VRRTAPLALALVTGAVLVTGCSSDGDAGAGAGAAEKGGGAAPAGAEVHMAFTLFKEKDVAIKAGESLTFVNDNPIEHVIVQGPWEAGSDGLRTSEQDDGTFRLTVKDKGDTASQAFPTAGTYQFFCTIHKGMNGSVTVS